MNKILLTIIFLSFQLEASRVIEKTIFSYWDKPDIDIFYSVPETISEETKILFIMHGDSRSAERYITDWLPLAENRNVVLIAPKFSKELSDYGTRFEKEKNENGLQLLEEFDKFVADMEKKYPKP